jgi:hypothetical protein
MLAAILPVLFASTMYSATPQQVRQWSRASSSKAGDRFSTPTEAAYAASLKYKVVLSSGEIGAKIYADFDGGREYYTYGPPLYSEVDPQDTSDEIVYDYTVTDGHTHVVGLWHEHAVGSTWYDLYGHYETIRQTHQAIWTTLGHDFFVQYFDGTTVQPQWTAAVPAIQPICSVCV